MLKKIAAVAGVASLGLLTTGAQAAAISVTDVVTDISAQAAPVALIGTAVLVLFVGIKAFKWVRKALS